MTTPFEWDKAVQQPNADGCYEWMAIRAGKPSTFCAETTFKSDINVEGCINHSGCFNPPIGGGGEGGLPCNVFFVQMLPPDDPVGSRTETTNTNSGIQELVHQWKVADIFIPLNRFVRYVSNPSNPLGFQNEYHITKPGQYRVDIETHWRSNDPYDPESPTPPPQAPQPPSQHWMAHIVYNLNTSQLVAGTGQANAYIRLSGGGDAGYRSQGVGYINAGLTTSPTNPVVLIVGEQRLGIPEPNDGQPPAQFEILGDSNFMITHVCETPYIPSSNTPI